MPITDVHVVYTCEDCSTPDPLNYQHPVLKTISCTYTCETCQTKRSDNYKINNTIGLVTGWNPQEKTFVEYCGKESFTSDHEILDKVPMDRAQKRNIAKIKYDKGASGR